MTRTDKTSDDKRSLCRSSSIVSTETQSDDASYGTIVLQIQEANEEAVNTVDFLRRTGEILWNTRLTSIFLGVFLALPFAMIGIGSSYRRDCPREPRIPIYLLVGGCFGFLKLIILLCRQVKTRQYDKLESVSDFDDEGDDVVMTRMIRFTNQILSFFLVTWFILGNVWVFGIWKPNYRQRLHAPQDWCDRVVYLFAVYQLIGCHIIISLTLILLFVVILYYFCCPPKK